MSSPNASLAQRLGGALFDRFLVTPLTWILLSKLDELPAADLELGDTTLAAVAALVYLTIYWVCNGYLLATRGQSIGKLLLGARIVDEFSGERPKLRHLFLRELVSGSAEFVPVVGGLFALLDTLAIFGDRRQCVHDVLASTRVVPSR